MTNNFLKLGFALLTFCMISCFDTKTATENASTNKEDASISKNNDESEQRRKLDSIRQVKEHGHAH